MADYVLIRKSRNMLSSFLHVFLNLVLAIGSIYITFKTTSVVLGLVLVLLSKWRMFAVRPRYWVLNLKSNLVDLIVGCSFVVITSVPEQPLCRSILFSLFCTHSG